MPLLTKKRENILGRVEVEDMIENAHCLRDKAMISILYILGCRITEALNIKKDDIILQIDDMVSFRIRALKRRDASGVEYSHKITVVKDTPFMENILAYIDTISYEDKLFDISRVHAWRIIDKLNKNAWCHLFRHTRLTKLAEKGASPFQLQTWAGWKSIKNADSYVQKSDKLILDLANKVD